MPTLIRVASRLRAGVAVTVCAVCAAVLADHPRAADRPAAARVEITRDSFGVPHIAAEDQEAIGFGLGYAQAEDHIEAIARQVLEARGTAAAVFGRSEADQDFAMRRAGNLEQARAHMGDLDSMYRDVLSGFAAGVNHYAARHRARLPAWIPEVSDADFVAITRAGAAGALGSASLARALEAKFGKGGARPPAASAIDLGEDALADAPGSNALALAGSKTTSGRPILLGNPHLRWSSLYWEAHVTIRGHLDFYGSTLAGLPWLRAGFNDRLGYVQTNNAADLADLFALPIDPANPDRYKFDGRSRPLLRQEITIDVRQDDGTIEKETRRFWVSHLGPIVYRNGNFAFAYRSTALDAYRFFEGFWRLSHARSLRDFRQVMEKRLMPSSNFTYADAAGNILYVWNARLPRRVAGISYALDVPAANDRYVWSALHKSSELPQMLNPRGGYVQNANNPPWFVSRIDPLVEARYPQYVERGELGMRPQLALELLGAREKFSPDDVLDLKFSPRLLLAERVKADLLAAADAASPSSEALGEGREIIAAWDCTASASSVGTVLFQRFWERYRQALGSREPFAQPWDAERPYDTPFGLADRGAAARALEGAVIAVREAHGTARVAYGDVNRFRFSGIDLAGDGASGQLGAYRVVQFDLATDGRTREAGRPDPAGEYRGFGDAWILLVHFTRPVAARSVLVYGQSSRPDSPHALDQVRLYATHQLRPVWFYPADVAKHIERRYRP